MAQSTRTFTTYQDFEKSTQKLEQFIKESIEIHIASEVVRVANDADMYDAQRNVTINKYVQTIFTLTGASVENFTASNRKIASNFFNLLNTQRCSYSLDRGISFTSAEGAKGDKTKEALGDSDFDDVIHEAAYNALKHGQSFVMVNLDQMYVFPLTQFVPMFDETTGVLRAGIRFWRLGNDRPLHAVFYEEDGYTTFKAVSENDDTLRITKEKSAYKTTYKYVPAEDDTSVIGEENYSSLPIVPMYGSRLHQSTLVGMRETIDSYDLINSGFANDVTDCAEIYWIIENYGGMNDKELARFRDRLLINHIANADTSQGGKVTPYTQDVPYQAREAILNRLRSDLYRDFCALDTMNISAAAKTATEIESAYQPVDSAANDFEKQITKCIKQILAVKGMEQDTPVFSRNRVSNQLEQVQMVMAEAAYLDEETVLRKLPNITPDEVDEILSRNDTAAAERMMLGVGEEEGEEDESEEEE